ncbi:hypothetical protein FGB62_69g15 [Gracilaria domingensis]|nr:hypothetical protein FGB62_69g15 [Gracilaria domingensis]
MGAITAAGPRRLSSHDLAADAARCPSSPAPTARRAPRAPPQPWRRFWPSLSRAATPAPPPPAPAPPSPPPRDASPPPRDAPSPRAQQHPVVAFSGRVRAVPHRPRERRRAPQKRGRAPRQLALSIDLFGDEHVEAALLRGAPTRPADAPPRQRRVVAEEAAAHRCVRHAHREETCRHRHHRRHSVDDRHGGQPGAASLVPGEGRPPSHSGGAVDSDRRAAARDFL